jgi:DNA repair exonuclease SbcCD ATPase subunit
MAKKQRDDTDPLAHLDKDARKRLEKLGEEWRKEAGGYLLANLGANDLRLLLENFHPLHELIRQIAATASGQAVPSAAAQQMLEAACSQAESEKDAALVENLNLQEQLDTCHQEQTELHRQLLTAEKRQAKLEAENHRLTRELGAQQHELAQLRLHADLPPVLGLLRRVPALAERLGLGSLPDDTSQALIRTVAVLSQMDNIERLWDTLKEGCERECRPASAEETTLLQTALDWHNHNWQKKPFALHRPGDGKHFDFSKEQRAANSPSGEALSAVWLPGIVSGNGTVQKKALVSTR